MSLENNYHHKLEYYNILLACGWNSEDNISPFVSMSQGIMQLYCILATQLGTKLSDRLNVFTLWFSSISPPSYRYFPKSRRTWRMPAGHFELWQASLLFSIFMPAGRFKQWQAPLLSLVFILADCIAYGNINQVSTHTLITIFLLFFYSFFREGTCVCACAHASMHGKHRGYHLWVVAEVTYRFVLKEL